MPKSGAERTAPANPPAAGGGSNESAARVLLVTDDFGKNTGFARVARHLIAGLKRRGHVVTQLAWFYWGDTCFEDRNVADKPWGCFRYKVGARADYGRSVFDEVVLDFHPDVVLTVGDVWMVEWIARRETRDRFYWIAYFPIDGEPLPASWITFVSDVEGFGKAVPYSEWAAGLIRAAAPEFNVTPIYHGVDASIFRPLSARERARGREHMGIGADDLVVLSVNRNQPRKRYPLMSQVISPLMDEMPHLRWHIHADVMGDVGGDLRSCWRVLGMAGGDKGRRLTFTLSRTDEGLSDADLNRIYNVADVHFSLAQEGFGLSTIEAMAAGVPVVLAEGSANTELVRKSRGGVLVPSPEMEWIASRAEAHNAVFYHRLPRVADAIETLRTVLADARLRQELAANGRAWAKAQPWRKMAEAFERRIRVGVVEKRSRTRPVLQQLLDKPRLRVLVREEKGGIGDMLSLSVALRALKTSTECRTIVLCRGEADGPRAQLLRRLAGVDKVIVPGEETPKYDLVVDVSDACAKGEAPEIPNVRSCRAEIYCAALGVEPPADLRPRLSPGWDREAEASVVAPTLSRLGLRPGFVGLGLRTAESYKDWPMTHWQQLRGLLHERGLQTLAWGQDVDEREMGVMGLAALTAKARCVVSADTVFLHLAGTLEVPAVGLFGPSGGFSRVKAYPCAVALQCELACSPCWRNASTRCVLEPQHLERSKCMWDIPPQRVAEAVMSQLEKREGAG